MQHGVLQWRPKDRSRRFLILRYEPTFQSNWSDAGNIPPSGKLNQRLIRSRKARSLEALNWALDTTVVARLAPETQELIQGGKGYGFHKQITDTDSVELSANDGGHLTAAEEIEKLEEKLAALKAAQSVARL